MYIRRRRDQFRAGDREDSLFGRFPFELGPASRRRPVESGSSGSDPGFEIPSNLRILIESNFAFSDIGRISG
jgi:hypothetical protein